MTRQYLGVKSQGRVVPRREKVFAVQRNIFSPANGGGFSRYSRRCYYRSMTTWESGRESGLLDDIITGRKTIEGRLNRGKFTKYKIGDTIWLRRDYRDSAGTLQDGEPHACCVRIVDIRHYNNFLDLTQSEDFKAVIPYANTAEQAADEYNNFYSSDDQKQYGVLAIQIILIPSSV